MLLPNLPQSECLESTSWDEIHAFPRPTLTKRLLHARRCNNTFQLCKPHITSKLACRSLSFKITAAQEEPHRGCRCTSRRRQPTAAASQLVKAASAGRHLPHPSSPRPPRARQDNLYEWPRLGRPRGPGASRCGSPGRVPSRAPRVPAPSQPLTRRTRALLAPPSPHRPGWTPAKSGEGVCNAISRRAGDRAGGCCCSAAASAAACWEFPTELFLPTPPRDPGKSPKAGVPRG